VIDVVVTIVTMTSPLANDLEKISKEVGFTETQCYEACGFIFQVKHGDKKVFSPKLLKFCEQFDKYPEEKLAHILSLATAKLSLPTKLQ